MRAPEERIGAFIAYAFDFIRSHPARPLFESESGFVMSYLLDHLPSLRGELVGRLGDALDAVPAVAGTATSTANSSPTSSSASSSRAGSSPRPTTPRSCSPSTASCRSEHRRRMDMETEADTAEAPAEAGYGREPAVGHGPRDGAQPAAGLQAAARRHAGHGRRHAERCQRHRAVAKGGHHVGAAPARGLLLQHGRGRPQEQAAHDPAADRPARAQEVPQAARPDLRPPQDGRHGRGGLGARQPPDRPVHRPGRGRLRQGVLHPVPVTGLHHPARTAARRARPASSP